MLVVPSMLGDGGCCIALLTVADLGDESFES
ncbi:hypothetical protein M2251_000204 [Rhodococcus erythropolis]|nr:hypothetical protein [Rhodococcus erythropolis]